MRTETKVPTKSHPAHESISTASSPTDLALNISHKDGGCLPLEAFYKNQRIVRGIPPRLQQIADLLLVKFDPNVPWPTQVIDSFRDGFLKDLKQIRGVLWKPVDKLTLREMLLNFYWFFRSVHMCNKVELIADRLLQLNDELLGECKLWRNIFYLKFS